MEELYDRLNVDQKAIIDQDMKNMKIVDVNNGQLEVVNPQIVSEAYEKGARALCSFISGELT